MLLGLALIATAGSRLQRQREQAGERPDRPADPNGNQMAPQPSATRSSTLPRELSPGRHPEDISLEYVANSALSFRDLEEESHISAVVVEDCVAPPVREARRSNACLMPEPTFFGFPLRALPSARVRVSVPSVPLQAAA